MPMKPFCETLKMGHFMVTAETSSTKGSDTTGMIECIESLRDKVHAISATDNKSAVMRYPSLGTCLLIKELNSEPMLYITCRDRNRLAIQADLLFAWSRGISTVLCLTGDSMDLGEDKQAKVVCDLDCNQLISLVHTLNSGKDMTGGELNGGTDFCIGVTTPARSHVNNSLAKLYKKLAQRVDFIIIQPIYSLVELKSLVSSIRQADFSVKILAGIMPVISVAMGKYMNSNMPGAFVPEDVLEELARAPKGKSLTVGMELAARMIRKIHEDKVCDGVHIMFPGREQRIGEIIELAGLPGVPQA
jgi:methylenetetrahydrofolate reductase (NADPH)